MDARNALMEQDALIAAGGEGFDGSFGDALTTRGSKDPGDSYGGSLIAAGGEGFGNPFRDGLTTKGGRELDDSFEDALTARGSKDPGDSFGGFLITADGEDPDAPFGDALVTASSEDFDDSFGDASWWLKGLERRLRSTVEEASIWAKVVFLCGEAGMGKTHACKALLARHEAMGIPTRYVSLADKKSEDVAKAISGVSRTIGRDARKGARWTVVLDDLPASEECDLLKQGRSLRRLVMHDAAVIVCARPEAMQLAEDLGAATILRRPDMIVQSPLLDHEPLRALTNGIPSLVAACAFADESTGEDDLLDALTPTLLTLVAAYLRETLPQEEQALRLALMLLGSGPTSEIDEVVTKLDPESLPWLHEDAPLFGIDLAEERFCCAALCRDAALAACGRVLREPVARMPEVAYRCASLLAAFGSYRRATLVASLLGYELRRSFVREWGVELVCAGQASLVEQIVKSDEWTGGTDLREQQVYLAFSVVADPAKPDEQDVLAIANDLDPSLRGRRRARYIELLRACRDLDCGMPRPRGSEPKADDDEVARTFATHLAAREFLLEGRVADAYRMLVNDPARLKVDSLAGALLCDDFEIAEVLAGEEPTEADQEAFAQARQLIEGTGIGRLSSYRDFLEPMLSVLVGRETHVSGLESVIAYAGRMGDHAIAAVALLVGAIGDNRAKAYTRAHVRAHQVRSLVSGTQRQSLCDAAALVDALSNYALGEEGSLVTFVNANVNGMMRDLAQYFVPRDYLGREPVMTTLAKSSCSVDTTWLLNMLCNDFGETSMAFRRSIPRSWHALGRRAVRKAQSFTRTAQRTLRLAPANDLAEVARAAPSGRSRLGIEISILGKFAVTVNGRPLDVYGLDRRRGRGMLIYLAALASHQASRYELIDSVWSDYDYEEGRQRIYEATTAIRRTLGYLKREADLFLNSRSGGMLGLNMELFSVDVDKFERAARSALTTSSNDEDVIARACGAMEIYVGDICPTQYDARGDVAARRRALGDLFADVAMAGASAALREGRIPLASRIARRGLEVSPQREDVAIVLIEALKLAGRYLEAREVYQRHARTVIEATGMPPSARLREVMGDVYPAPARKKGGAARQAGALAEMIG